MKKILMIFVLLSVVLFGSDAQSKYDEAIQAYKAKDYKRSYELFSDIYLAKLSSAKVNFYFGRSAFESGHYEVALAAFERVDMLDAGNLRNKLEMARTYFMLKMYEDSQLAFEDVLSNPNLPQNVRTNLELYLSKVRKVQQKSFTYATINLDWMYDSNVNYASLGGHYDTNIGSFPSSEQSDRALQVYGDIVNIYDIGGKSGFAIKNRVSVFLKDYKKLNAYDVGFISYTPSILYKDTKYLGEFAVGLDLLSLGKEEYLRTVSFTPKFEYGHTNTIRSIVYFKYQQKYFIPKAQYDLNADHYEGAYALQDILSPRSYVQMNLVGIQEKKHHGTRIDVNYDEYRVNLVYANQFSATYGGELFTEYRRRDYADRATRVYSNKRADDSGVVALTLNARVLKTLRLHLKGMYNKVESNQDKFSYHKYTVTLGLNKTF